MVVVSTAAQYTQGCWFLSGIDKDGVIRALLARPACRLLHASQNCLNLKAGWELDILHVPVVFFTTSEADAVY